MKTKPFSTTFAWLILTLLTLVILAAVLWANLQWGQTLPPESEFFNHWQITQGLIFDRTNPYDKLDGYQFTAPLPLVLFYFPFALIENFELARAAWITALQLCGLLFAYFCWRSTDWEIPRWFAGVFLIFALFWFPAVGIYLRGSETIFMAALFAAALLAIQNQQDEIGGVLLALAALQPRVSFLGVLLILLWAASQRRWLLHFWAGITFVFTTGLGMVFFPRWLVDYFWAVLRNTDFSFGKTVIETTTRWWPGIGQQIGRGLVIAITLLLVIEWWLAWGKNARKLTWSLALTWVLSIWIGFETNLDHVFWLLLPLVVIFAAWHRRWGNAGSLFNLGFLVVLFPGLWWAFLFFQQRGIEASANPILMLAFPLLVMIGLYWVRWWYLRPTYLNLSES